MVKQAIAGKVMRGAEVFEATVRIDERGIITAVTPGLAPDAVRLGDDEILRAGDVNAHSHPEQSVYTDLVDPSWDLATWCRHTIYHYSTSLTPRQVRLACRRAFARMVGYSVTSVFVSFYLHNNAGNRYDLEVIAAARDVGIRLLFGRMNYDIITAGAYEAKQASQHSYFETPQQAAANFRELMAEESDRVLICPALHSMHANTPEAIVAGIALGCKVNRPVQFHLSEDQGDVDLSLKEFGVRPLVFLEGLVKQGVVPSLSGMMLSDCCWIDDEERDVIARHSMKVVLNARMNDRVKAGFPDLPALLARGIVPWLGTDGEASNDDLSVQGERELLKRRFDGVVEASVIDSLGHQPFQFGAATIGSLCVGAWADLRIERAGKLQRLMVGGHTIFDDGHLLTLDVEQDIEEPLRQEIEVLKSGTSS